MRLPTLLALGALLPAPLAAQADSARFIVRRGADTVAVERYTREDVKLRGVLEIRLQGGTETTWSAVTADDGSVPLLELTVRQGATGARPRHIEERARVIIRPDSVAVDQITSQRLTTRLFPTQAGAVPYLNLSVGLLEQAIRRADRNRGTVPLFNLSGGQTVAATVTHATASGATLALGNVTMEFTLDGQGRIVKGAIPAQQVTIERVAP